MRPEFLTHENIKEKLISLGWKDRSNLKPTEGILIEETLKEAIKRLNSEEFKLKGLTSKEEERVLNETLRRLKEEIDPVKVLDWLKNGIDVSLDLGQKGKEIFNLKLIDFENLENNEFFFIHEKPFTGQYNIRPDFTLFINGIPVAIIEAKREISEEEEYTYLNALRQIEKYEIENPKLFNFVQLGIGIADKNFYIPTYPNTDRQKRWKTRKVEIWKEETREGEYKENIFGILKPEILTDLIENFIFFQAKKGSLNKVVARYIQYYAVNKTFKRVEDYLNGGNKNRGLIWHWQGSGKTWEIIFLAEKFYRKYYDRDAVVFIIVDRRELEDQFDEVLISLRNTKFVIDKRKGARISSIEEFTEKLKLIKESEANPNVSAGGVHLVMMHKFTDKQLKAIPEGEIKKKEILLLRDEAHRTEGGKDAVFSAVRNHIFKNASLIGFTGTPVHKRENSTFETFAYPREGEFYLHRYFIADSIRDGYTVPLTFRVAGSDDIGIKLNERELKELINLYKENRDIEEISVSEREFSNLLNLRDFLKSDSYLEKVAQYIVENIETDTEEFAYKAMIAVQSRKAAVVLKRKLDEILSKKFENYSPEWVEVVITYQNDDEVEIKEYLNEVRQRYGITDAEKVNKRIVERFKESENPKVLIVNRKLLTGFDCKKLKVLYLAEILNGSLLLQASARVNRPYPGKEFGLIVDLTGVSIENYKKAIQEYNLYEQKEINEDILKNLFKDSREIWETFLRRLEDFKNLFENITGLTLEEFSQKLTSKSSEEVKETLREVVGRVFASNEGFYSLIPLLGEITKHYEIIGGYPEKAKPQWKRIYKTLKTLQVAINRKLRPTKGKIPKEIEEEILKGIEFGEIKNLDDLTLDEHSLEKLLKEGRDYLIISDWLIPLANFLEQEKEEPLYKLIYKRLKQLQKEYREKVSDARKIINELKSLTQQVKT
ncbi:MAG: HsdR family type I site-specific deoxyribonuclease, partial [Aquificae bacterium]|nr:HsdR family type I site-specific deoxyribonuclease [Aquificota bacterium]